MTALSLFLYLRIEGIQSQRHILVRLSRVAIAIDLQQGSQSAAAVPPPPPLPSVSKTKTLNGSNGSCDANTNAPPTPSPSRPTRPFPSPFSLKRPKSENGRVPVVYATCTPTSWRGCTICFFGLGWSAASAAVMALAPSSRSLRRSCRSSWCVPAPRAAAIP